jgi:hypothetical protein
MKEMDKEELMEINAGKALGPLFGLLAFAYLVDVATHLEDHIDAFMEGYNAARN